MPSERYRQVIKEVRRFHAARKTFSGRGCLKHLDRIAQISQEIGATSALDYGCGKGAQYTDDINGQTIEQVLGYAVAKYDPCVPEFEVMPDGLFELVWCVDVLEMVPAGDLQAVLHQIASKATKAVFITVSTYPAKKSLLNGENAHITVKPSEWWEANFRAVEERHQARALFIPLRFEWQIG